MRIRQESIKIFKKRNNINIWIFDYLQSNVHKENPPAFGSLLHVSYHMNIFENSKIFHYLLQRDFLIRQREDKVLAGGWRKCVRHTSENIYFVDILQIILAYTRKEALIVSTPPCIPTYGAEAWSLICRWITLALPQHNAPHTLSRLKKGHEQSTKLMP